MLPPDGVGVKGSRSLDGDQERGEHVADVEKRHAIRRLVSRDPECPEKAGKEQQEKKKREIVEVCGVCACA